LEITLYFEKHSKNGRGTQKGRESKDKIKKTTSDVQKGDGVLFSERKNFKTKEKCERKGENVGMTN